MTMKQFENDVLDLLGKLDPSLKPFTNTLKHDDKVLEEERDALFSTNKVEAKKEEEPYKSIHYADDVDPLTGEPYSDPRFPRCI